MDVYYRGKMKFIQYNQLIIVNTKETTMNKQLTEFKIPFA